MAQNLDELEIGRLFTSDKLKANGLLTSPSIGKVIDLVLRPDLTADSPDVEKSRGVDTSPVYEVREIGRMTRDVAIQDYTGSPLDMYLTYKITETTLSDPIVPIDGVVPVTFTITLDSVVGAAPGLFIEIWEGSIYYQGEILSVDVNNVTLYTPIGFPFSTNATVYICDADMATAEERDYTFEPGKANTRDYHVNRFIVDMTHSEAGDDSRFGDIVGGLTDGVYFGGRGTISGITIHNFLYNFRTNGDFRARAYDVTYPVKAGTPSIPSLYGTAMRKTFNGMDKSGVTIQVYKSEDNAIIGHTRDAALATLEKFRITVMGHQTSEVFAA